MTITDKDQYSIDYEPTRIPKVAKATPVELERIRGHKRDATMLLSDIVVANDNIRDAENTDIESLAKSIRQHGLLQPLGLELIGDGRWLLAFGYRRYLALLALHAQHVPVTFKNASEHDYTRTVRMIAENNERQDLNPIEEAQAISRLVKWYDMTQKQVAEVMNVNKNLITSRLRLLELPPEAQSGVADGSIPVEVGARIGRIIKGGAAANIIDDLLDRARTIDSHQLAAVELKIKGIRASETLRRRLEARGIDCATSERTVPHAPTEFVRRVEALELSSAEAVKALVLDKLNTIRGPEGRPIVIIERRYDGKAVAWMLATETKVEPAEPGARVDYEAARLVRTALLRKRIKWARDETAPGTTTVLGIATATLLHKVGAHRLPDVAEIIGMSVMRTADGDIGVDETINAWMADPTTARLQALAFAAATACATGFDRDDHGATTPAYMQALVKLGMPGPLTGDDWTTAVEAARVKIDDIEGPDLEDDE